jgi:peptidoglycan/xylan/chitin deacetylase (PgdA/CDA1 family)
MKATFCMQRARFSAWAKSTAYKAGASRAYHRLRNRSHLTTVMFHRILPRNSAAWSICDRHYTLPTDIFADCLSFLNDNYSIISLTELGAAKMNGTALPEYPLLITFDDGWADTLDCAAKVLRKLGLPAACFVAIDALDDPESYWWQETFALAWRCRQVDEAGIREAWSHVKRPPIPTGPGINSYLRYLMMLEELPSDTRRTLLRQSPRAAAAPESRDILTPDRLGALLDIGIEIGAHGMTHLPLTMCRDPAEDLTRARLRLNEIVAGTRQVAVTAVSFPHGRFDQDTVQMARDAGYRLMFTSQARLNSLNRGCLTTDLYNRIEIPLSQITDNFGGFRAERMAALTFFRTAA